jgi:hypothetical protein
MLGYSDIAGAGFQAHFSYHVMLIVKSLNKSNSDLPCVPGLKGGRLIT